MNFRRFEVFKAVMETPSVTQAATQLNVTQPAVSKSLQHLEEELGLRLFERQRGRLIATEHAHDLYEYMESVFRRIASLKEFAAERRELRRGHVTIGAMPMFASLIMPRVVARFRERYPRVTVSQQTRSSAKINELVENGLLDMGLAGFLQESASMRGAVILRLPGVCVLPKRHRLRAKRTIKPEDLVTEPFISTTGLDGSRGIVDALFDGLGASRNIVCETTLAEDACLLAREGVGVTVVNALTAQAVECQDVILRPLQPTPIYEIFLITTLRRPLSSADSAFLDVLRAEVVSVASRIRARPA